MLSDSDDPRNIVTQSIEPRAGGAVITTGPSDIDPRRRWPAARGPWPCESTTRGKRSKESKESGQIGAELRHCRYRHDQYCMVVHRYLLRSQESM